MASASLQGPIVIGDTIGRWTVISEATPIEVGKERKVRPRWLCQCACGVTRAVLEPSLTRGISRSCGCLTRERSSEVHTRHGHTKLGPAKSRLSPEYSAWKAMRSRCEDQNDKRFADYGGRGILVCAEWKKDFAAFLAHVGPRPGSGFSLDRIDNERGYEPGNVKWSTPHEQMTNRRNSRFVTIGGKQVPLSDLAAEHGIPANTLRWRILSGWPVSEALTTPVRPKAPHGAGRAR